jgi:DNA-binding response OmpR family regulator
MKILLVDDDKFILELVAFMLGPEGFEIMPCSSVTEAISTMEENDREFDLVITDIIMPEQDGTKLAQYVSSVAPSIPVLAMTAGLENAVDDYVHLADMFADETIAKPLKKDELLDAIKRLTGS